MPFLGRADYSQDKSELLGQVLQEGNYQSLTAFDKARAIMSNSARTWDNIEDWAFDSATDRGEDLDFQRELTKRSNLDIVKKDGVNINDIPYLRNSKDYEDFNYRVKRVKRFNEEGAKVGAITKDGGAWGAFNVASTILEDPLFVPSLALPLFAPARLGRVGRALTSAGGEMAMSYGYSSLLDVVNNEEREQGDVIGDMLLNGFLGATLGAFTKGRTLKTHEVESIKNSLIDEVTNNNYTPENITSIVLKKEVKAETPIKEVFEDIKKEVKEIPTQTKKEALKEALPHLTENQTARILEEVENDSFTFFDDIEPPFKKEIDPLTHPRRDEALDRLIGADRKKRIQGGTATKEDLDFLKKEIEYLEEFSPVKKESIRDKYPDNELFAHPKIEEALARGESVKPQRAKGWHQTINADGTRTTIKRPPGERELFDNRVLTPAMVKRIRAGKATKNDLKKLKEELDYLENSDVDFWDNIPLSFSGGLTVGSVAFLMSGEDLQAGDTTDYSIMDIVALGGMALLAWKNRRGLKEIANRAKQKAQALKNFTHIQKLDNLSSEAFGIIGGTRAFHKAIDKLDSALVKTKEVSNMLLDNVHSIMNAKDQILEPISSIKEDFRNNALAQLYKETAQAFEEFKTEISFKTLNPIKHIELREEFYKKIGEAFTRGNFEDLSPALQKGVQAFRDSYKRMFEDMKKAGVEGFEEMEQNANYMPRYHKPSTYDWVSTLNKTDTDKVIDWYADSIKRGFIKEHGEAIEAETAIKYAKQLLNFGESKNFMEILKEDDLFTNLEITEKDYFSRAKFRIPIDFNVADLRLGEKDLRMVDFVETNAYNIVNRYANTAGGHVAFGVRGIKSVDKLLKEIRNEFKEHGADIKARDTLIDYIHNLIGRPILDYSSRGLIDFTSLLKKATTTQLLHASALSTLSEILPAMVKNILNSSWGESWKAFKKAGTEALNDLNPDSITEELIKFNGYGEKRILSESLKNPRTFNSVDEFGNSGGVAHEIDKGLTAMQRVTFFLNQLPALEDFANVFNIKTAHTSLMEHLRGTKPFNPRRAETIGLNEGRAKVLQGILGKVTDDSLHLERWTDEEIGAYKTIITQMQRANVGELALGDKPLWIIKNPIFNMLTSLLSYPLQSFDNLMVRDIYARDGESLFRFKMMMTGTALSLLLKDKVNQRETKQDEFMQRVIMALPHTGVLSIGANLFNEKRKISLSNMFPSLGVLENAVNMPNATRKLLMGEANAKDEKVLLQMLSVPMALQNLLVMEKTKEGLE